MDPDTAAFAMERLRRWGHSMGRAAYPGARCLLISADGGGSNSSRSRLWKLAWQDWADELRMSLAVCRFPPVASKWNKIEHRMFSYVPQNWRGRPPVSCEVVASLIGAVKPQGGLSLEAEVDENAYATARKVMDIRMEAMSIERDSIHGEWNCALCPRSLSGQFIAARCPSVFRPAPCAILRLIGDSSKARKTPWIWQSTFQETGSPHV